MQDNTRQRLEEEYQLASTTLSRAAASFAGCRKKTERRVKESKQSTIKYIHDVQKDSFGKLFGHLKGAPESRKVVGVHKLLLSRFESTQPIIPPLSGVSDHCGVRTIDRNLENVIHWCCRAGEEERLVRKIEAGGDVEGRNNKGETPLHVCAFYNQTKCCQILLDHGVKIDCVDNDGWAPIHWAVHQSNLEITKLLISRKADINLKLPKGGTPLDLAAKGDGDGMKMLELIQQFEEEGNFKVETNSKWSGVLSRVIGGEGQDAPEPPQPPPGQQGPAVLSREDKQPSLLVRRMSQRRMSGKQSSLHPGGAPDSGEPLHISFANATLDTETFPKSPLAPGRSIGSPIPRNRALGSSIPRNRALGSPGSPGFRAPSSLHDRTASRRGSVSSRAASRSASSLKDRAAQRLEELRRHMLKEATISDRAIHHRVYPEKKVLPLMQGYGPIVYLLKSCQAVTLVEVNQQTTAKILANNFGLGVKGGRRFSLVAGRRTSLAA